MRFAALEIAHAVNGRLVGPDIVVSAVTNDSRAIVGGELFVPLVDVRDGHDFIAAARDNGAVAYLTAREPTGGSAICVDDPAAALVALARLARVRLDVPVIGITGSVGKTSCKDMAASILGQRFETASSLRSFNNEIGVPLTLCNAPDETEAIVVEMGARGPAHIAALCAIARPTVGVVTIVSQVHTELFGDLDDVARAKGELIEALPAAGTAVLFADDPRVSAMADRTDAAVLRFGVSSDADVRADAIEIDDELHARFGLVSPWGSCEVRLGVRGAHQVANALAAATASLACGVGLDDVVAGLAEAELSPWRMELGRGVSGILVLNDAYNAGPASMEAALRSLAHLEAERRVAVLGPMAELGAHARDAHRAVAELAGELGIEVVAVGTNDYGDGVVHVASNEDALQAVRDLRAGDAVLVKGSRVAGMEKIATALRERV